MQTHFVTSRDDKSHQQSLHLEEMGNQSSTVEFKDNKALGNISSEEAKKTPPCNAVTLKEQNVMPYEMHHQPSVNLCGEQPDVLFVHLKGSFDVIASRLSSRKGHFFNSTLLQSQFNTLEDLEEYENGVVINIDNSEDQVVSDIVECLTHHNIE